MAAKDVFELFITPMRRRFIVPQGVPEEGFLADVADALGGYSVHQLAEAASWFRDNRTQRTFPSIAECRQTCWRFTPHLDARLPRARSWQSDDERRSESLIAEQRRGRAAALCRGCDLAWQAREEGWLNALLEFATDNERLPDDGEWRRVRAKSQQVDANLHREPRPAMYASLCQLRAQMQARAARDVFGDDAARPGYAEAAE